MSRARAHFYQAFRGLPLTRQCSIQTERVSRSARASEKKMNDAFDRRQRQCSVGLLQAQNPSKARGWAQAPLRSPLRGAQGAICAPGVGRSGPYSGPRHAPTQRHGARTVHTHNRSAASRFNKKHNRVRGQASLVPQSVRFDPRSTRAALASAAADTSSVEWQQMARTALSVLLSGLSISPVSPLSPTLPRVSMELVIVLGMSLWSGGAVSWCTEQPLSFVSSASPPRLLRLLRLLPRLSVLRLHDLTRLAAVSLRGDPLGDRASHGAAVVVKCRLRSRLCADHSSECGSLA